MLASRRSSIKASIKEELETIFDFYQRTNVVSLEGQKSTGVDLVIAKNILTAHNGELNVECQDGRGTTFAISLTLQLSRPVNGQAYD